MSDTDPSPADPADPADLGDTPPPPPCGDSTGEYVCVLPAGHDDEWHRDDDGHAWAVTAHVPGSQIHEPHITDGVCTVCGETLTHRRHPHAYAHADDPFATAGTICTCGLSVFAPQHNVTGDVVSMEYRQREQDALTGTPGEPIRG